MRPSHLISLLVAGPLGCASGVDPTGPCRQGSTSMQCSYGPTVVEVNGDLSTCGFTAQGLYAPQPTSVCVQLCPSNAAGFCSHDTGDPRKLYCGADAGVISACTGRRPQDWSTPTTQGFEALVELEAASVVAFSDLVLELTTHHAPSTLVERARAAIRDERRHTAVLARLARVSPPKRRGRSKHSSRTLYAMLCENAAEGCVRETYGAAVGSWVARYAHNDEVRAAFGRIAVDEGRHADLAWDVHAWGLTQLPAKQRRELHVLVDDTVRSLECEVVTRSSGLVPNDVAVALFAQLNHCLWHTNKRVKSKCEIV